MSAAINFPEGSNEAKLQWAREELARLYEERSKLWKEIEELKQREQDYYWEIIERGEKEDL